MKIPPAFFLTTLLQLGTVYSFSASSFDYEYIRDESRRPVFQTDLPSAYSPHTPAGLRGEAVQSAMRSNQCIAYRLQETPLSFGLIKVVGEGCMDFLNNKLSQTFASSSSASSSSFRQACWLNAKGQVIDQLGVGVVDPTTAFLLTSPRHDPSFLYEQLDRFIFPLDKIHLENCSPAFLFTLASARREYLQRQTEAFVLPLLKESSEDDLSLTLPDLNSCYHHEDGSLLILPTAQLTPNACFGYTFCFFDAALGEQVWQNLIAEHNADGAIEIGALEYETLRIEAGMPAFGLEMRANDKNAKAPASPLELHLEYAINTDKGCYLGQEGIASLLKNPRGPPRTLYHVVFDDESNLYEPDQENLTRMPVAGDPLFVLGSNEEIAVGSLTSVAEPGATGEATTLALALVRRADSIRKQLKERELEVPEVDLDGLEVIVGGTYTVGRLRTVPSKRLAHGQMYFSLEGDERDELATTKSDTIDVDLTSEPELSEADLEEAIKEAEAAKAAAEAAAAEAKRKAEKMEMLRKRAEEAIARRKKKQ